METFRVGAGAYSPLIAGPEWLVPGVVPVNGHVVLSLCFNGPKAAIASELAVSIALGDPFLGACHPWGASGVALLAGQAPDVAAAELRSVLRGRGLQEALLLSAVSGVRRLSDVSEWIQTTRPRAVIIDRADHFVDDGAQEAWALPNTGATSYVAVVEEGRDRGWARWAQVRLRVIEDLRKMHFSLWQETAEGRIELVRFVVRDRPDGGRVFLELPILDLDEYAARAFSVMRDLEGPIALRQLRGLVHMRHDALTKALKTLEHVGVIESCWIDFRRGRRGTQRVRGWRVAGFAEGKPTGA